MMRRSLVFAAGILSASLVSAAARAELIYDNTSSTFTGSRAFTALQIW